MCAPAHGNLSGIRYAHPMLCCIQVFIVVAVLTRIAPLLIQTLTPLEFFSALLHAASTLCHKTRFAYTSSVTSIDVEVLHVALAVLFFGTMLLARRTSLSIKSTSWSCSIVHVLPSKKPEKLRGPAHTIKHSCIY